MPNNSTPSSLSNRQGSTRPLDKCIDIKHVRDWVPQEARYRIDLTTAWRIIKREFCAAVVSRGVCPVECERCREEIIDLFRLEKAEKPEALLTWLAKDHSARWIEKLIAAEKVSERGSNDPMFPAMETPQQAYDRLFPIQGEETNLFLELLKDYEKE